MPTSLHPKLTAIMGAVVALAVAIKAMVDGDPTTNPDWSSLATTLILAAGLFTARQNGVTSEQVIGAAAVKDAAAKAP